MELGQVSMDHTARSHPGYGRIVFPYRIKKELYQAQRGRCYYCGRTHRIGYLEIDHKWPVSRGGGNQMSNLQLLCTACNMRKGVQGDEELRSRYWRLLPSNGDIPSPPIGQEDFADETQRTRASREVRSIYHRRFDTARRNAYNRRGSPVTPLALIIAVVVIIIIIGILAGD